MRILTYLHDGNEKLAISVNNKIYDLEQVDKSRKEVKVIYPPIFFNEPISKMSVLDIINMGTKGLDILRRIENYIIWLNKSGDSLLLRNAFLEEEEIKWLPPISNSPMVFGIGGNSPLFFRDKDYQIPAYPRGFIRPVNKHSIIGHRNHVVIPENYSTIRASAELGVIIGKPGKNISPKNAMDYVWGYTLVNDMCSDSWKAIALGDIDEEEMHKDLTIFTQRAATSYYSRSTDGFAAIGPYAVTKDEIPNPYDLMVWNNLSGKIRERGLTQAMVNGVERTISFLSNIFTIQPGMIFHMGTMGIDGYTIESDMKLSQNDYFEIEYENIGSLRTYVNDLRP